MFVFLLDVITYVCTHFICILIRSIILNVDLNENIHNLAVYLLDNANAITVHTCTPVFALILSRARACQFLIR